MIAYNTTWLNNLFIQKQVKEAFHQNFIEKDEMDLIINKFPVHFYSTNLFIRIGLFILTTIIVLFSIGLFALLMSDTIDRAIGGMAVFFGLIIYGTLEYMVQAKKHFKSGVDDALLWISAFSLFGGISFLTDSGDLANCLIVFIISIYYTLRFADRLMSIVCYASFLGLFFFTLIKLGPSARLIMPFVLMIISVVVYLGAEKIKRLKINHIYFSCLQIISIFSLLSFYLSGNYFVVRELSNLLFNRDLGGNEPMPLGWLFWVFTWVIPCFYFIYGIKQKDIIFIRLGLLLIAAIVFTVRYYFSIVPLEVAMAAGGIALIVVSYVLTSFLRLPKFGFTYNQPDSEDTPGKLQLESILQVQTFSGEQEATGNTKFGGGSFGGGGVSGQY